MITFGTPSMALLLLLSLIGDMEFAFSSRNVMAKSILVDYDAIGGLVVLWKPLLCRALLLLGLLPLPAAICQPWHCLHPWAENRCVQVTPTCVRGYRGPV